MIKINKEFLILFLGRFFQALLSLVAIRVLTSTLSKEQVGFTYVVTTLVSYFSLVFINPIGMYLNRHLHTWHETGLLPEIFRKLNKYFLFVSICSIPIIYFVKLTTGTGSGFEYFELMLLVAMTLYFSNWFQTLCPSLNMLEFRMPFVLFNLFSQLLGLVLSIGLSQVWGLTAYNWLLGFLIGQVFVTYLAWIYFKSRVFLKSNKSKSDIHTHLSYSRLIHFAWPIAVTTFFVWTQSQSYRIYAENISGAVLVANLAIGFSIVTSIAGFIESIVSQYFYPQYYSILSKSDEAMRTKAWQNLFAHALSIYLPVSCFILVCSKSLLALLVHKDFSGSLDIVLWGVSIEFFRMTTNIVYAVSQSEMKTKATIWPYASGATIVILGMLMRVVEIPQILSIAGLTVLIFMVIEMRKVLKIHIPIHFIVRSLLLSAPLFLLFFAWGLLSNIWSHLLFCLVAGVYILIVIWLLQKKLQVGDV